MNPALWRKTIRDAWLQLAVSCVLLILFARIFVWLMTFFQPGMLVPILKAFSWILEPLAGVPLDQLATATGRVSILFVHAITLLVCIGWAVGRGSDAVSGEIGRGTMDLLLSLPVRRASVIVASAAVTAAGSLLLALSVWLGAWIGILMVDLSEPVDVRWLAPGVPNLAAMTFCLAGLTTLASSWGRDRWRTICLAGGYFALSSIVKMIALLAGGPWAWLRYFSFLTPFEPQQLILLPAHVTGPMAWWYNGTLVGIGLLGYAAAAIIFSVRDIPAAH